MATVTMKRHEWRRHMYRNSRDLDHLSPEELSERLHDCINNIRTRTVRGKLGLLPVDEPVGETWMTLFTEVLEECNLRGYPYPGPISTVAHRSALDHAFDPIPDMDRALADMGLEAKPFLLKFGDARWLRLALDIGKMRIASASYYGSDAQNHARRDTELDRFVKLNPRDPHGGALTPTLSPVATSSRDGWATVSSPTDYFLFSMAAAYSARLFGDFASTACLIVHEPREFLRRVVGAIAAKLPGWRVEVTRVTYYDPVRVDPKTIVVPKFKPFKHSYQGELRIVCVPPNPIDRLTPFEIEIGPLTDCAALVDLSSHPPQPLPHDPTEDPVRLFGTTAPEASMVNKLPNVARMQGLVLDKSGSRDEDWYFQVQYTDDADAWHEIRVPLRDGLYLLNLLKAAEQDQPTLALLNREP